MAGKKVQVPVMGGLRKVIQVTNPAAATANPGTTITEFANQTVSLAQLKQALGLNAKTNTGGGGGVSAAINLGPGLAGGGVVQGAVPINLLMPFPAFIFEEGGGGGGDGDPGPPGASGTAGPMGPAGPSGGPAGPPGPATFLLEPEQGEDGWSMPGQQGAPGGAGLAGAVGPAIGFLDIPDLPDEMPFVAPPIALRTINKGANWASSAPLTAGAANIVYVNCPVAGTIQRARLVTSGGPGSCVVDVWKAPFGSFPPLVGNSITASAKPAIAAGTTFTDATLTGWTRSVNAGDVLAFVLQSTSTFTQVQIVLEISQ